jgi:hypothetical protein
VIQELKLSKHLLEERLKYFESKLDTFKTRYKLSKEFIKELKQKATSTHIEIKKIDVKLMLLGIENK